MCLLTYVRCTLGINKSTDQLDDKVVIVTGGNAGIGFEAAMDLAERGARVILACRNEGRGTTARDRIIEATGNQDVHYRNLDLASFDSIRAFAEIIIQNESRLDILINNAGIYNKEFQKTEDGLLLMMKSNHFGPFLLTNLLLPLLKSSAPSRIINVSSVAHKSGKIDFDNLNAEKETEKSYKPYDFYANSKLCNILMTIELDRRLEGTRVTANSLHPGVVQTELISEISVLKVMKPVSKFYFKTPKEGAQTTIHLAVAPEVAGVSGRYFADCHETSTSKLAQDKEVARKLWEESEKIVKLK